MLFLLRSSKTIVAKVRTEVGVLGGATGLNLLDDLTRVRQDPDGQIVGLDFDKPIEQLLEDADGAEIDAAMPMRLVLPTDRVQRSFVLARLRRMAMDGTYEWRLLACKTLGKVRDLENVPALIFALSDPDFRVVQAAREALQLISRSHLEDGLVIENDRAPDAQLVEEAQRKWTEWLLSVKPDAELFQQSGNPA
jgi:hypothetical protein